ncbi:hypothetical protein EV286_11715 [Rhizobium sp. BK251]|nr:hypothetical protein EV286_11715 [Rhizobium sp. BK251]
MPQPVIADERGYSAAGLFAELRERPLFAPLDTRLLPDANPERAAFGSFDVEVSRFADEVAQFLEAECPRIEIRCQIEKLLADRAEANPAVIRILLSQDPLYQQPGRIR